MNKTLLRALLGVLCILVLALQYRLWFAEGSWFDNQNLQQRVQAQNTSNGVLRKKNAQLADEVAALKHGQDEIEARAREQFGMVKKDETFFLLLEEPTQRHEKKNK